MPIVLALEPSLTRTISLAGNEGASASLSYGARGILLVEG
jgi:hypothetical protein